MTGHCGRMLWPDVRIALLVGITMRYLEYKVLTLLLCWHISYWLHILLLHPRLDIRLLHPRLHILRLLHNRLTVWSLLHYRLSVRIRLEWLLHYNYYISMNLL